MCEKFICIAKCPELDNENLRHCIDTKEGIIRREDELCDYCPCGNTPIWKPIEENLKEENENKRKITMWNILNNISYYEILSKKLTIEISYTMQNPLKQGNVIKNWNNKCRAIKQKQKAQRRINNYIKRLRIIYNKLNNGGKLRHYNLVLKEIL